MAKGKYEYWLSEDGLLILSAWARDGLTDNQIAKNIGISRSTLNEWKIKYPDISDTLKKGKEIVDIVVENALLEKALGVRRTVKKPIKVKEVLYEDGKRLKETEHIEYADEEIYIPPDTTAQIYWLKNRKSDKWRDKPISENNDSIIKTLQDMKTIAERIQSPQPNRDIKNFEDDAT